MKLDNLITSLNIPNDEYLIVGVSSGPDSMALLDLLKKNCKQSIVCTHINHNVRESSKEEELYLKEYCKENSIIFECKKIDSWKKNNFEAEARTKRYEFYEQILNKYHSHTLFLAHHGDDLIETILMKIIRGSNLEGYAGIKKYSKLDNYTIIRPLLSLTKKDILKYNEENNIKYFIDKSNESTVYTRNRIRKRILPLLKQEDEKVHLKFLKYSDTLQEYYNYVEEITKDKIKNLYKNNIIDIDIFNKEHSLIKKSIIFYILSNIYQNTANIIKDKHIQNIISLANNQKPNAIISLPQNYYAKKIYNKIYFEKDNNKLNENYKIIFNDKININNIVIEKVASQESDGNDVCRLNSKDIKLPLYIRNKLDGDYIEVLGLNGKKKISDIFIEKKIPKNDRLTYPILVDSNDNILWIPYLKKSKYNVKKNEICDIILTSYKKGGNKIEEKRK